MEWRAVDTITFVNHNVSNLLLSCDKYIKLRTINTSRAKYYYFLLYSNAICVFNILSEYAPSSMMYM